MKFYADSERHEGNFRKLASSGKDSTPVLDKHPSRIGQMFNRIAPTYDFLNHFLSAGIDIKWRKMAVRDIGIKRGDMVLDLACGTGDLGLVALRRAPGCTIVGIDLALKMLRIATEKTTRKGFGTSNYSFLSGDILRLPFKKCVFDKAMIAFGIRNVMDTKKAFDEIYRVLKPGGSVAVLEFSLPSEGVLRDLYLIYFRRVLPFIGGLVSRDPKAYRYLPSSVKSFTPPEVLSLEMESSGFIIKKIRPFTGGITYLIVGKRTSEK